MTELAGLAASDGLVLRVLMLVASRIRSDWPAPASMAGKLASLPAIHGSKKLVIVRDSLQGKLASRGAGQGRSPHDSPYLSAHECVQYQPTNAYNQLTNAHSGGALPTGRAVNRELGDLPRR